MWGRFSKYSENTDSPEKPAFSENPPMEDLEQRKKT